MPRRPPPPRVRYRGCTSTTDGLHPHVVPAGLGRMRCPTCLGDVYPVDRVAVDPVVAEVLAQRDAPHASPRMAPMHLTAPVDPEAGTLDALILERLRTGYVLDKDALIAMTGGNVDGDRQNESRAGRAAIERLRDAGWTIISRSNRSGYWLSDDREAVAAFIAREYDTRIRSLLRGRSAMRRGLRRLDAIATEGAVEPVQAEQWWTGG